MRSRGVLILGGNVVGSDGDGVGSDGDGSDGDGVGNDGDGVPALTQCGDPARYNCDKEKVKREG
jgi:hypothetical protein